MEGAEAGPRRGEGGPWRGGAEEDKGTGKEKEKGPRTGLRDRGAFTMAEPEKIYSVEQLLESFDSAFEGFQEQLNLLRILDEGNAPSWPGVQSAVEDLQDVAMQVRAQLDDTTQQKRRLDILQKDLRGEHTVALSEIDGLKKEIEGLKDKLALRNKEFDALSKEKGELCDRVDALEDEGKQLKGNITALEGEKSVVEGNLAEKEKDFNETEAKLGEQLQENSDLR